LYSSNVIDVLFLDSWPYPEHRDVWDRIENTFQTEDDFEDLQIQDFVLAGRQTARRRLDRLTMPRGQTSVLERGSLQLREHERLDTSVDTALGYTSIVGTMLAEELANAEDQVGTLDCTCFRVCPDYLFRLSLFRSVPRRRNSQLLAPTRLWPRWWGEYESWRCPSG